MKRNISYNGLSRLSTAAFRQYQDRPKTATRWRGDPRFDALVREGNERLRRRNALNPVASSECGNGAVPE